MRIRVWFDIPRIFIKRYRSISMLTAEKNTFEGPGHVIRFRAEEGGVSLTTYVRLANGSVVHRGSLGQG